MTLKEFKAWCNQRACDGCWSMETAMLCIHIVKEIEKLPFWKRKKAWDKEREFVEENIVKAIEEKMKAVRNE